MLDWLRRSPRETPAIDLGGVCLPVIVRRLDRARRMTLRLAPDGTEVRVSIPRWGRTADALEFAESRRDWLSGQLVKVPPPALVAAGGSFAFRGADLHVDHVPGGSRRVAIDGGSVRIGGPAENLAPRLRRWLQNEARSLIAADLGHYCEKVDRLPPKLALSSPQRRWGSCAADGSIRINWRLVMAPDFVRRSVVAHEVAHLVHFDHSPRFHALLREIYEGDIALADRWLKREGRSLYAAFG